MNYWICGGTMAELDVAWIVYKYTLYMWALVSSHRQQDTYYWPFNDSVRVPIVGPITLLRQRFVIRTHCRKPKLALMG